MGIESRDECPVLADLRADDDGSVCEDDDLRERKRIKRLAETGLVLACSISNVRLEMKKTSGLAGSRNASSQRRTISAESEVT